MKLFSRKQPKQSAVTAKVGAQPPCCGGQAHTAESPAAKPTPTRKADSASPPCCGGKNAH